MRPEIKMLEDYIAIYEAPNSPPLYRRKYFPKIVSSLLRRLDVLPENKEITDPREALKIARKVIENYKRGVLRIKMPFTINIIIDEDENST